MKNKKSFFSGLAVGIAVCAAGTGLVLTNACGKTQTSSSVSAQAQETDDGDGNGELADISGDYDEIEDKLETINGVLDQYYLTDKDVSAETLEDGIYKGYVDALGDQYTVYYTPDEYSKLMESTSGEYSGIGAVMQQDKNTMSITILRVFDGSPAQEAGIEDGDVLTKVGGEDISGQDLQDVVSNIKGEEGTTVDLTVYRSSDEQYHDITVERRTIETPMVDSKMLDGNIGYIDIYEFEDTTADQFRTAYEDLSSQGMQGLIIDLRNNPGGLVDSATNILDQILPSDQLLVYTIDKNGSKEETYSEDDDQIDIPMVVLMNGNSASASEITAGCLQDYGKAKLIGTQSFGKGIVQYVLKLNDGSALKVTGAKYYSPNGRNIQGTGLTPDIEVEDDTSTDADEQLNAAQTEIQNEINGQ